MCTESVQTCIFWGRCFQIAVIDIFFFFSKHSRPKITGINLIIAVYEFIASYYFLRLFYFASLLLVQYIEYHRWSSKELKVVDHICTNQTYSLCMRVSVRWSHLIDELKKSNGMNAPTSRFALIQFCILCGIETFYRLTWFCGLFKQSIQSVSVQTAAGR